MQPWPSPHTIEAAKQDKEITPTLFVDVRGAFDNASKARLPTTLSQLGIPRQVRSWTDHFLSDKQTALAFDGQQEPLRPVQGESRKAFQPCPYYSFSIYGHCSTTSTSCRTASYIDDIALVVTGISRANNARQLEAARVVFQWVSANTLPLTTPKLSS